MWLRFRSKHLSDSLKLSVWLYALDTIAKLEHRVIKMGNPDQVQKLSKWQKNSTQQTLNSIVEAEHEVIKQLIWVKLYRNLPTTVKMTEN